MKIVLGSDHAGVQFKQLVLEHLASTGHETVDVGTKGEESVDYPDFAFAAAEMVAAGEVDRGILICGSGIGMSIAANKVTGVRAALCLSPESADLTRRHNDSNVLALAGWQSQEVDVLVIVDNFLSAEFEGGRHARRVNKITEYEERRDKR
jgi:ribose 5-phosphate isomerase B